jgi:2-polyprenyl-3-methyl-5-hydroxy-6-metoxy-1,4-benzoquinol methylase
VAGDLFKEKAEDWDSRPLPAQISEGVFGALKSQVVFSGTETVLDFGAGTGLVCSRLAPEVGKILAVDISESMLEKLAQKPELAGKVEIFCQDILEKPLAQKVDLVVSAMALHHVKNTDALLKALFDHLVPGGKVALADLDAEDGTFHPPGTEGVFHHGFERQGLSQKATAAGFSEVAFTTALEVGRDNGTYPIFLMTAEKPE